MSKSKRKYPATSRYLKILKVFSNPAGEWRHTLYLVVLTYISQLSFWEKLGFYSYLDAAFIVSQKFFPNWFPLMWGSVIDTLYHNPFGVTSVVFFVCQILSYFMKKIWRYRWFYIGCALSFVILLHDLVMVYFYNEKISFESSIKGLFLSMFFVFMIEPFYNRKKTKKLDSIKKPDIIEKKNNLSNVFKKNRIKRKKII